MSARRSAAIAAACAVGAFGVTGFGAALTAGTASAASAAAASATTTLPTELVPGLAGFTNVGAVVGTARMTVGVGMTVDTAARSAALTGLVTAGSPTYHQFYTPVSFEQAFGVDQAAAARVKAFATRDGLSVTYASADGSYLELTGVASQVDSTFGVVETGYHNTGAATADVQAGASFVANNVAPTVPASVDGVSGLNTLMTYSDKPTAVVKPVAAVKSGAVKPDADISGPEDCEGAVTAASEPCIGALTPSDVRSVYSVPATDLGAGQKIAIFGEGELATVVSQLRGFESTYNQPQVPVKEILIGDDLSDSSGDVEWELDSQASTGMAPNIQELDFYFGSDLADPSITATYNAWVNDPLGPLTGNSSFGGSEQLEELDGFLEDVPLQQAVMEGRTMFTSSGDVGGSCLPGANGVTNTGAPCVEYPASSPYANGVGGTVLYTQGDAAGLEVNPPTRNDEYAWTFSGGGVSDFEKAPSWQPGAYPTAGATTPAGTDVPAVCVAAANCMKGVPDVTALSGDSASNGYAFYSGGAVSEEGGTSLASPLWAGMWANVEAAFKPATTCPTATDVTAESAKSGSPGFAPPDLYAIAANTAADAASFFNVGGTTKSMPASNGQQSTNIRMATTDPTGYSFVAGLGSPMLTGIIGNIDCGNTTAVSPALPTNPGTVSTYVYGTTPPYDNLQADGCGTDGQQTASGTVPTTAVGPLDLLSSAITSDVTSDGTANANSTTFATTVSTLTGSAATDYNYAFEFSYGADQYAVTIDTGANPVAELYMLAITSTPAGLGVEATPTALAALATPVINTATNTVSVTMPFAVFNANSGQASMPYGTGSQLTQLSVFSNAGPATTALANDFNVAPDDQIDYFQCPYVVPGTATTPSPTLPETPVEVVLPLAALAVGGWALRRRTRSRRTAA